MPFKLRSSAGSPKDGPGEQAPKRRRVQILGAQTRKPMCSPDYSKLEAKSPFLFFLQPLESYKIARLLYVVCDGGYRLRWVSRRPAEHHCDSDSTSVQRRRRQHSLILRKKQAAHQEGLLSMQQAQDQVRSRRESSLWQLRKATSS